MGLEIWGLLILLVITAIFGFADYFGVKTIKERKVIPLKRFYLVFPLSYFLFGIITLIALTFAITVSMSVGSLSSPNLGFNGFFIKTVVFGLMIVPATQLLFMLIAHSKYVLSILNKKWLHVLLSFGAGILLFILSYIVISGLF